MDKQSHIKTIAVSQETFDKLSEDVVKRLKENILNRLPEAEDVEFIILPREEIFKRYLQNKQHQEADIIILSDEAEEKERIEKERELAMRYASEIIMPPVLPDIHKMYPQTPVKQKPYVPHVIGRPDSKKKGGR